MINLGAVSLRSSSKCNLKHHTGIAVSMSVRFNTCKFTSPHVHSIKVEPPSGSDLMFVTTWRWFCYCNVMHPRLPPSA
jgi:hypothetical protein